MESSTGGEFIVQTSPAGAHYRKLLALAGVCIVIGVAVGLLSAYINPLILLGAVPTVVVGFWAIRKDKASLWLLIAVISLLPRFAAPVKLVVTPTVLDVALLLLMAAWLFRYTKYPLRLRDVPITLPLVGLISVAIVTFIVGLPNGSLTPLVLRRFAELVLSLSLVFVLIAILRYREALDTAMRVFMLTGALAALIGIVLYILPNDLVIRYLSALRPFGYPTGSGVVRFINDDPALMKRATGLWIDPNAYGGFLLIISCLTLPQLCTRRPVLPRWISALTILLTGLALVLTVSRGAMLGLVIVAVMIGILRYRPLLLLVIVAILLAFILPQTRDLINHFAQGFAGQDLSTQMRFGEYKDAIKLIQRYPLLGVGFASTPDVDLYIGVSMMYLLIAQQMGLLGLAAFLLTIGSLLISAWRARRSILPDEGLTAIWLGAYGAITGALISGIFDHYFFNIDFHNSVMLLWTVIAVAIASQLTQNKRRGGEVQGVLFGETHYNLPIWKSV